MKQKTKFIVLVYSGVVALILAVVFAGFLGYTLSQEKVDMVRETIFGIFTVMSMCGTMILWVFAFLVKDKADTIYGGDD